MEKSMQEYTLETADKVFSFATRFIHKNQSCFRGHIDSSYKLVPSVGRLPNLGSDLENLEREKFLLREFKMRSVMLLSHKPSNDWEWLSLAQHHGLPTRLLDWTMNPLVALYFATCHSIEELYSEKNLPDAAIYMLISHIYIDSLYRLEPFSIGEVMEFHAPLISTRVTNQSGIFTAHPTPTIPFRTEKLKKFIIPGSLKREIQARLSVLGIEESNIYPGLDGLAKSLKYKFFTDTCSSLGTTPTPDHAKSQIHGL